MLQDYNIATTIEVPDQHIYMGSIAVDYIAEKLPAHYPAIAYRGLIQYFEYLEGASEGLSELQPGKYKHLKENAIANLSYLEELNISSLSVYIDAARYCFDYASMYLEEYIPELNSLEDAMSEENDCTVSPPATEEASESLQNILTILTE